MKMKLYNIYRMVNIKINTIEKTGDHFNWTKDEFGRQMWREWEDKG